ncbi:hypothetical protein TCT1_05210 [Xenorhabdus sp. TCT-1]|uniref:Uncharacterized protein n=1 Tax=Xenorhabdus taiwanensis TaxID=3085177 RepID=A0ABN7BZ87_9GAMM|nr:hypothetical protein TCT1_05210 [Xenorhabdus sp. TCT-1]
MYITEENKSADVRLFKLSMENVIGIKNGRHNKARLKIEKLLCVFFSFPSVIRVFLPNMTVNPLITPHITLWIASAQTDIVIHSFENRRQFIVANNRDNIKIFSFKKILFILRIKKDIVIQPIDNPIK